MLDCLYSTVDDNFDKKLTTLTGIDFSAVFDTISHCTLLKRLEIEFGIEGIALSWLTGCSHNWLSVRHIEPPLLEDCNVHLRHKKVNFEI